MRLISFQLTQRQILARTKNVTRRAGWLSLKAGDRLQAVEKGMGLKRGETVKRLALLRVVNVRRELMRRMMDVVVYGRAECVREGFPEMTPAEFVAFFCASHRGCTPETEITRIEFVYL